jgi:hypothetical protein
MLTVTSRAKDAMVDVMVGPVDKTVGILGLIIVYRDGREKTS